tara:strand:+ start:46585 stop:47484 length:900 start_codon:yes stop_codon:yes gene_type:complete
MKLSSTEKQNPISKNLDTKPIKEILKIINNEDSKIAGAVNKILPEIEKTINFAVETIKNGKNIFYVGAGTSGRLGVLDAAECVPTFSVPENYFQGIIAGGNDALVKSIENSEDDLLSAENDLKKVKVSSGDLVIGIASSGTTPYVLQALKYSKKNGCKTVFLICNKSFKNSFDFDVIILVDVGQEVIAGSTRMKSGTATKMILNMISTTTMVKIGKVYDNLMIDLKVVNNKLFNRAIRIINTITGLDEKESKKILIKAKNEVKVAIVMHNHNFSYKVAKTYLQKHNGSLREVLSLKFEK